MVAASGSVNVQAHSSMSTKGSTSGGTSTTLSTKTRNVAVRPAEWGLKVAARLDQHLKMKTGVVDWPAGVRTGMRCGIPASPTRNLIPATTQVEYLGIYEGYKRVGEAPDAEVFTWRSSALAMICGG